MTVAYVKNADGSGGLCQNTFRDTAGAIHILSNYYKSEIEIAQIFFDYLPTTTPTGKGQIFIATDNRGFIATDQRIFKV